MEAPTVNNNQPYINQYNLFDTKWELELNTTHSNLSIKARNLSKVENGFYYFEDSKENIYKLDRYFLVYETLEEIKDNIIETLKDQDNFEIKQVKDNEIKLILKIQIGKKIKNIEFSLTKKEIAKDDLINVLIDKINLLENKINEYEELFGEEIKERKKIYHLFNEFKETKSKVLNKIKDYNFIINNISKQLSLNENQNIKLTLIYQASKDGMKAESFHKFCDYKGPTLTIIKTKNNIKFGGYLNIEWKSQGGDTYDKKAFIFSLDRMKIYLNNGGCATNFSTDRGPYFGYAINIYNDFTESGKHCVRTLVDMKDSWNNVANDYELNGFKEYFDIEEIEVFKVLLN